MHIVIVGGGQVGSALARALAANNEVFVIDHDPDVGDVFQSLDVEFVLGSGTSEDADPADVGRCDVSSPPPARRSKYRLRCVPARPPRTSAWCRAGSCRPIRLSRS
jgi:NAD(P)-dependent dehydrogenase (short-subunit alcohol dehydrogenase family)